jgi:hypothetical protein
MAGNGLILHWRCGQSEAASAEAKQSPERQGDYRSI